MFTEYYMPMILVASILLLLFLCYRFQKSAIPLPHEACDWSGDHWVTNTSIQVSRLNEIIAAKLPDDNPTLTLQDWFTDKLGRAIKPNDIVSFGDRKFMIADYRDRRHNKVYIYRQTESDS